jgi:signal transduction histidine kinase/ligand-binding sensor domain-containing protein
MSVLDARAALAFVLVAVTASGLRGQHSTSMIGELGHTTWNSRDGAPANVNALAQSADGVLWIGTFSGLYRFDGIRFEPFESEQGDALPALGISTMLALPDSTLWLGYFLGGASVLSARGLTSYTREDGLPEGSTNAIVRDSTEQMWLATTTGLARLHAGRWQRVGMESGYPGGMTNDLLVDRRGTLWASTNDGVFTLRRGASHFFRQAPSLDPIGSGFGIPREAADGSVWGSSTVLGLTQLSDSNGRAMPPRPSIEHLRSASNLFVDHHDDAWVVDASGLLRVSLRAAWTRGRAAGYLPSERVPVTTGSTVGPVLEDREGNVWVGTSAGIERFRKTKFTPILFPEPAYSPVVVAGVDDEIWIASMSLPLHVLAGLDQRVPSPQPEVPAGISCGYRDPGGGLWFGGRGGMWHAQAAGLPSAAHFVRVSLPKEAGVGDVQAFAQTPDGDLWLSMRGQRLKGIFRRHSNVWTRAPLAAAFAGELATTIITDAAGRVWLGYTGNRMVRIDGDSARAYSTADGLHVGNVTALLLSGPRLWIGGESGLAILENEHVRSVKLAEALRGISGIVETKSGDMWLNAASGVTHIGAEELRRALQDSMYRARTERFDHHDGIMGEASQVRPLPTATQSADGRLWVSTTTGVSWIDPEHIERNRIAPPVQIRTVSAGGRSYGVGERVSLPKRTTQIQIAYTALSLSVPDRVRFRYRLTGVDTAWVDAGTRREAFYTNLGPGLHRFHVIASNEDDVWNTVGATVDVDIPPTLTQTRLFTVLMAIALLGAAWLLMLWRQRQVARAVRAQFEATLGERARVARELHDTLLGDMAGVAMQLGAVARRIEASAPEPAKIAAVLSTLSDDVRRSLIEARRAVTAMRAPPDALSPLHEHIASEARRILNENGIAAHVEYEGDPTQWAAPVEAEILSIAAEAMTNARKHAGCTMVTVACRYDPQALHLRVRDDGRGFDARRDTPAGHWGLVGMRERAASIGAELRVNSAPSAGTEIVLVVPRASARWRRWKRLLNPYERQ